MFPVRVDVSMFEGENSFVCQSIHMTNHMKCRTYSTMWIKYYTLSLCTVKMMGEDAEGEEDGVYLWKELSNMKFDTYYLKVYNHRQQKHQNQRALSQAFPFFFSRSICVCLCAKNFCFSSVWFLQFKRENSFRFFSFSLHSH